MNDRIIIAIDPDVKKSGVATYSFGNVSTKQETLPELISYFDFIKDTKFVEKVTVVVEASWLIQKTNWRTNYGTSSKNVSNAQSLDAGRNQGFGMAIVQIAKSYGFQVIEQKPLQKPKGWKVNGSWTPTGRKAFDKWAKVEARINDDGRDALYLLKYFL